MSKARILLLGAALGVSSCADETITGYADPGTTYQLQELDGRRFNERATVRFPRRDRIEGESPCGSYAGTLDAIYPWFDATLTDQPGTRCPDRAAERGFFAALRAVTLAEVSGPVLVLSNEAGRQMVFRKAGPVP